MEEFVKRRIKELDTQIKAHSDKLKAMDTQSFSEKYNSEFISKKRIIVGKINALASIRKTNADIIKGERPHADL